MKAIKALVAVMTLLLVAGLGVLGWGLSNQAGRMARPAAAVSTDGFGAVSVPLPAGARVGQALAVGDRLVLRLSGAGAERFIVLDPASGAVAGSFDLAPEAPK